MFYLHPYDGPNNLKIKLQLTETRDYRTWKSFMQISLSTKRKHGYVIGALTSSNGLMLKETWEACNNMLTTSLLNNMTESIRR